MPLTHSQIFQAFVSSGALLEGHFQLSSGLHSDQYLEKFRLVENPRLLEPLCKTLASRYANAGVQIVLGPTTAGIILAYTIARILGVEARYAERAGEARVLRRGQTLPASTRVLVVDDVLTTGGAVRECIHLAREAGAVVVGVGILADRSGGSVDLGARVEALLTLSMPTYRPEACPLCRAGIPLVKPGSTPG
ncbi:MAG: orotate phosphoribosyltransferase [Chthonomonadales bacterium]